MITLYPDEKIKDIHNSDLEFMVYGQDINSLSRQHDRVRGSRCYFDGVTAITTTTEKSIFKSV